MKPLVSIIIPCYNVEDCVEEALSCALAQTYTAVEIIAVDNNSQDRTLDILRGHASRGRIRLLQQPIKGAPAARNMGWRAAQGTWIQFLDADDLIMPNKIAHQIRLLEQQPDVNFIAAATLKQSGKAEPTVWPVREPLWHGLLTNQAGNTVANLFSRQALAAVDGWDESLKSSQEYDLMFRIMHHDGQVLIDTVAEHTLIRSRQAGSISSEDKWGNQQRFLALMARICSYLKKGKSEVYTALPDAFFEDMYQRIRLNTIHGQKGSPRFERCILPKGFRPKARPYDPFWYRGLESVTGRTWALHMETVLRSILTREGQLHSNS